MLTGPPISEVKDKLAALPGAVNTSDGSTRGRLIVIETVTDQKRCGLAVTSRACRDSSPKGSVTSTCDCKITSAAGNEEDEMCLLWYFIEIISRI